MNPPFLERDSKMTLMKYKRRTVVKKACFSLGNPKRLQRPVGDTAMIAVREIPKYS